MLNNNQFYNCKFCNKNIPITEKIVHDLNCFKSQSQFPKNSKSINSISQKIIQNNSNRENILESHINNNNNSNEKFLFQKCEAELNFNERNDHLNNNIIENSENNLNSELYEEEIFNNDGILISQNIQTNYNSQELINGENNIYNTINYSNTLINRKNNNGIISNLIVNKIIDDNKKFCENKCIICQENYKIGDNYIFLPCIHFYHENCIKIWINKQSNCPLCKRKINEKNLNIGCKE